MRHYKNYNKGSEYMKTIISTGTSSSSHTYGNVSSSIKEITKSFFPQNFFNYTHISTELLSKEMKTDRINSNIEFSKKTSPILTINPIFTSVSEDDKFLGGTLLVSGNSKFNSNISRLSLMHLFGSKKDDIALSFMMNRDRLIFEMNIFLNTEMTQLDVYNNLKNYVDWNIPVLIESSLESMIPRSMIEYIGKLINININNESQTGIMLDYLNNNSAYPITYKMRNSSSRDEFFMYFNSSLLVTFSDLEISEGTKKGMVGDIYPITFRTTVDFNLPGAYYLIGDINNHPEGLSIDIVVNDSYQKEFIPIFTINNLFNNLKSSNENFKLYSTCLFKTEPEINGKDDKLPIDIMIKTDETKKVIKQHIANSIPIDCFLEIVLLKDNTKCEYKEDWYIDWNTFTLTILNSDSCATYRLILFIDNLYLNNKILDIIEADNYDKGLKPNETID